MKSKEKLEKNFHYMTVKRRKEVNYTSLSLYCRKVKQKGKITDLPPHNTGPDMEGKEGKENHIKNSSIIQKR